MVGQLAIWVRGARPKTLLISACPVCIGTALAISSGAFDLFIFILTLLTAQLLQVGANLANDYFDFIKGSDTSERKGPQRLSQSGLISPEKVKIGFIVVFALAGLLGSYLIWKEGLFLLPVLVFCLASALFYTAGPYALAYHGLGEVIAFLVVGPIATSGTFYLQTHTLSLEAVLAGLSPGFFSAAVMLANNLRDVEQDRKANKNTLCVRLGVGFGQGLFLFLVFGGCVMPFLLKQTHPLAALASLTFFPALFVIRPLFKREFAAVFGKTPQLFLFFTLLFCIGWML